MQKLRVRAFFLSIAVNKLIQLSFIIDLIIVFEILGRLYNGENIQESVNNAIPKRKLKE